jgi:Plasmid recombination enzyme
MPYAIARIAKLKQANIAGSGMHVSRGRNTPNADRFKLEDNQTLIHNNDRHLPLSEVVHNKIHSVGQQRKIRTDAVHCVEILLTASPEYFRPDDPSRYGDYQSAELADWTEATVQWLKKEYGDKIVRAELHRDEATPHIHAYLVPTDENGQLNCKKIFGGRAKMFAFQDSYAAAMKPLGLERGIRNSQAEHTTVKDYYSVVNSASQELDPNDLQAVQARAVAYAQMQIEHQELQRRLKLVAQQRDELAKKLAITQESVAVQVQINQALTMPEPLISIGRIACELRLPPRQIDVQIKPIDLVMNTRQTDLVGATQWLTQKFGAAATIGLVNDRVLQIVDQYPLTRFIPPDPVRSNWGEVRLQLTTKQQLPAKLIDRLHDQGLIYADSRRNLICLHRDFEERVTGATRIDLSLEHFEGESKLITQLTTIDGSNLTGGWHYFQSPPQRNIDKVVIVDDPLEAIAYATLNPVEQTTLFLSGHEGFWMPGDKLTSVDVVVATDAQLLNLPRQVEYQLPQSGSWGEDLRNYLSKAISFELTEQDGESVAASEPIVIPVTVKPHDLEPNERSRSRHQGLSM